MFNAHKTMTLNPTIRRRKRRRLTMTAVAALGLVVAACGGGGGGAEQANGAAPAVGAPAVGGQITTAQTDIGEVLTDPSGLTLYGFIDDVEGVSTCFDTCATAWPIVDGSLGVVAALDSAGFDTISRPDGTEQLRVGGRWPLYTFAGDAGPGEINGQESGGVWFAVAPDGALIGVGGQGAAEPAEDPAEDPANDENGDQPASVVETELGPVMTNAEGLTVYVFANDSAGVSNCNEPCSDTWPPVTSIDDVSPRLPGLEVLTRQDGSDQIALDGAALYTYIDDQAPGDTEGQGIGDVWFAVSADGATITPPSVRIGSTDSGDILIDDDGFALYVFANDEANVTNCLDPCDSTWPPVAGDTLIDPTLAPAQFGQISRPDGTTQLTLHGQPLYTFIGDTNPGDTNGITVGSPGTWSVIAAAEISANPSADDTGTAKAPPADITVGETPIGTVATTVDGLTLYAFLDDTATQSACNDACADAWPPIPGDQRIAAAISADIATIDRADGSTQTVIGNWPAYTFAGDTGPGDVTGQGSGEVWFAIAPDGSLIR